MRDEKKSPLERRPLHPTADDEVRVTRDLVFAGSTGAQLAFDVYAPRVVEGTLPAIVIVTGYRDPGFAAAFGARFKDMEWTRGWASLFAAAGIVAFTYTNENVVDDLERVLQTIRTRAAEWRADPERIGIFAVSGHVPVALRAMFADFPFEPRCAIFAYGYMLDLDGATTTADAAKIFRFQNPCEGRSMANYRDDVPLLVARAANDEMPGLNTTIDSFAAAAVERGAALTLVNIPRAPHAFDVVFDHPQTPMTIDLILQFAAIQLGARRAG